MSVGKTDNYAVSAFNVAYIDLAGYQPMPGMWAMDAGEIITATTRLTGCHKVTLKGSDDFQIVDPDEAQGFPVDGDLGLQIQVNDQVPMDIRLGCKQGAVADVTVFMFEEV